MKRLFFLLIALLLASCTGQITIIITATPAPTLTPAPTATATATPFPTNTPQPPTPTQEVTDWVGLPRNPGAGLGGVNPNGSPNVEDVVSEGNPIVHVEWPLQFDRYGVVPVRWPSVYRVDNGTDVFYQYNWSYLSGKVGLGQFETACPDNCLLKIELSGISMHTTNWMPGAVSFTAELWPTTNSGSCTPTRLPEQSPPSPISSADWSAVWLIHSDSDWYMRAEMIVPWPIFGDNSVIDLTLVGVMDVGPDYGSNPIEIACQ